MKFDGSVSLSDIYIHTYIHTLRKMEYVTNYVAGRLGQVRIAVRSRPAGEQMRMPLPAPLVRGVLELCARPGLPLGRPSIMKETPRLTQKRNKKQNQLCRINQMDLTLYIQIDVYSYIYIYKERKKKTMK